MQDVPGGVRPGRGVGSYETTPMHKLSWRRRNVAAHPKESTVKGNEGHCAVSAPPDEDRAADYDVTTERNPNRLQPGTRAVTGRWPGCHPERLQVACHEAQSVAATGPWRRAAGCGQARRYLSVASNQVETPEMCVSRALGDLHVRSRARCPHRSRDTPLTRPWGLDGGIHAATRSRNRRGHHARQLVGGFIEEQRPPHRQPARRLSYTCAPTNSTGPCPPTVAGPLAAWMPPRSYMDVLAACPAMVGVQGPCSKGADGPLSA
ncbi:hypothetical protein FHR47_001595 [Xanthomonas arboricola]|nr:hypothetical protein [Xanthomonas cannabis]